ncbi:MAG: Fur family transcriptional regulator [Chloroflexi bacterium]|nr:Fur family transcriptional regulator [Chloroflexota bacterium]
MRTTISKPVIPAAQAESSILTALEKHGSRLTWPRRELAALLARRTDPFRSQEIIAAMPDLGRATIYRTLRLLVEVGLLFRVVMPDGSRRYSLDDPYANEHLVCIGCGRIDDFRHPSVQHLLSVAKDNVGRGFVGHRIEFYHRCGTCSETGNATGTRGTHGQASTRERALRGRTA